jgi:hypothetical protein
VVIPTDYVELLHRYAKRTPSKGAHSVLTRFIASPHIPALMRKARGVDLMLVVAGLIGARRATRHRA